MTQEQNNQPEPEIEQLYWRLEVLEKAIDALTERVESIMQSTEEDDSDG